MEAEVRWVQTQMFRFQNDDEKNCSNDVMVADTHLG
jgi:hypothetical protein